MKIQTRSALIVVTGAAMMIGSFFRQGTQSMLLACTAVVLLALSFVLDELSKWGRM